MGKEQAEYTLLKSDSKNPNIKVIVDFVEDLPEWWVRSLDEKSATRVRELRLSVKGLVKAFNTQRDLKGIFREGPVFDCTLEDSITDDFCMNADSCMMKALAIFLAADEYPELYNYCMDARLKDFWLTSLKDEKNFLAQCYDSKPAELPKGTHPFLHMMISFFENESKKYPEAPGYAGYLLSRADYHRKKSSYSLAELAAKERYPSPKGKENISSVPPVAPSLGNR